jgi:hypothetical protein
MITRNCKHCGCSFIVNKDNKFVCPAAICQEKKKSLSNKNYERNKEYFLRKNKERYWKNPKKHNKQMVRYRQKYSEHFKEKNREYYVKNRAHFNKLMNNAYYKNKKKWHSRMAVNNFGNRKRILAIIGNKCLVCNSDKIQIHHKRYIKIPIFTLHNNKKWIEDASKNFDEPTIQKIKRNLFPLCIKCHRRKLYLKKI